jgi:choline dehydrogenase-like flavoprotein
MPKRLHPFDKYSSAFLLVSAVREAAGSPDQARRLFLVPNTHVIKLNTAGGAVTSIQASFNGAIKTLTISPATAVVLALGTIESTRLALYSFPTSPDPSKELMGRNLMVHVRDNIQARINRSAIAGAGALPTELQAAALLVRGSTAQGKFHLQVTASADLGSNPDALLFSMIPDIDEIDGLLAMETSDKISLWFRGVSESKGDTTSPVPSQSVSYINLSSYESDEFGVPRAYVQIVQNGDFALADVMDAATNNLILKLDSSAEFVSSDRDPAGSTYHEAGTLWMGDDPTTSVTDANGCFHHVSNAYCIDQSLFPTVGSVNPTLTGLVLTRKVADAIIARPG